MNLSDLAPSIKNPRKISKEQLASLKESLEAFGDLSGIVYNRTTKRLVGGHQRAKALPENAVITINQTLAHRTKQGTVALGHVSVDGELYAYREVDWDEGTELSANIAANKHGGDWDMSILPDILLELDAANFNLNLTGFTPDELKNLLAPIHMPQPDKETGSKVEVDGSNTRIILYYEEAEYQSVMKMVEGLLLKRHFDDLAQMFKTLLTEAQ